MHPPCSLSLSSYNRPDVTQLLHLAEGPTEGVGHAITFRSDSDGEDAIAIREVLVVLDEDRLALTPLGPPTNLVSLLHRGCPPAWYRLLCPLFPQ